MEEIIVKSIREWASPMVIVPKKAGSVQVCIDYQKFNKHFQFDSYPMLRIDELLDTIGQTYYLTHWTFVKAVDRCPTGGGSE